MTKLSKMTVALLATTCLLGGTRAWADTADGWQVKNKVDEEVRMRQDVGLSKARTLGQSEFDKTFSVSSSFIDSLRFHTTLRASYDAVYDLNSSKYGTNAGESVTFTNGGGTALAWGAAGGTNVAGGFTAANNPNKGLRIVDYGQTDSGIQIASPVRPCNVDHRGCMPGYMDYNTSQLISPEFNERLDVLREAYVDANIPIGDNSMVVRFGRQQLVWGRTDLFRVLDVLNPVDYSRNNIYDELQDIRIPKAMLRVDYRMGATGPFDDLNLQAVLDWEKWRGNNLGQSGTPNEPLGAASFFRAFKTCWDYGCTVGNFASNTSYNFGPGAIGIRNVNTPEWSLSNMPVGGKVEGEYKGVGFSANALTYRSQMPSLRGGVNSNYSLSFDMEFPRINLFGGSMDFNIESIDTAIRMEAVYTQGEEFANTARKRLYNQSDVVRYVIGADRNTFIPFLNKNRAFLFSTQTFGQHLGTYDHVTGVNGAAGNVDFQDNWTTTLLIKGWYMADTLSPQVVFARDWLAHANVVEPSVEWQPSNMWRFRLGANVKFGEFKQAFDDGRAGAGSTPAGSTLGTYWGNEPLGRFKSGILGMAHKESEIFANATLRF